MSTEQDDSIVAFDWRSGLAAAPLDFLTYKQRLDAHLPWALDEGGLYFERRGSVQLAAARLAKLLEEANIPYALIGVLSFFAYGYRRFTEDIEVLVSKASLKRILGELAAHFYFLSSDSMRSVRDVETGVKISFFLVGQLPGNRRFKPISFPDPAEVSLVINGLRVLPLPAIVELQIAAGMDGPELGREFVDVQEMAKYIRFHPNFADQLHHCVRAKFHELCDNMPSAEEEAERIGEPS